MSQPAPSLSDLLVLSLTQVLMAGGYVPFLFLSRTGDISFIAPIMTLHTLFPTVYGFCTGEPATPTKILGIIGSFTAVGVLGADSMTGNGPDSVATLFVQLGLLLAATVCWGSSEIIAVRFGRLVRHKHAVLSQLVGIGIVATVCCGALVIHALVGDAAPIAPVSPPDVGGLLAGISALWLSCIVLTGHAMAGLGWLLYVRLGQLGDASQFAPIVQLYGLVSALFGIALAGEQVSLNKVLGMVISGVAIGLLGVSDSQQRAVLVRLGCASRTPAVSVGSRAGGGDTYTALATTPSGRGDVEAPPSAGASDPGAMMVFVASSTGSLTGAEHLRERHPVRAVSSAGSMSGRSHSQAALLPRAASPASTGPGGKSVSFVSKAGADSTDSDSKAALGLPLAAAHFAGDGLLPHSGASVSSGPASFPDPTVPPAPLAAVAAGTAGPGMLDGAALHIRSSARARGADEDEDEEGDMVAAVRERAGSVASEPLPDVTAIDDVTADGAAASRPQPDHPGLSPLTAAIVGVAPAGPQPEPERAASVGAPEGLAERQDAELRHAALAAQQTAAAAAAGIGPRDTGGSQASPAAPGAHAPILTVGGPSDVPLVVMTLPSEAGADGEQVVAPVTSVIPQGPFAAQTEFVAATSNDDSA